MAQKLKDVDYPHRVKAVIYPHTSHLLGTNPPEFWKGRKPFRQRKSGRKNAMPPEWTALNRSSASWRNCNLKVLIYDHCGHFIFPESMMKLLLPEFFVDFIIPRVFSEAKGFVKECRKGRIDLDEHIQSTIKEPGCAEYGHEVLSEAASDFIRRRRDQISSADHPDCKRQNSTPAVDVPFKSGDPFSAETYCRQAAKRYSHHRFGGWTNLISVIYYAAVLIAVSV